MDKQRTCRASRWTSSVHAGLAGGQAAYMQGLQVDRSVYVHAGLGGGQAAYMQG